MNLDVITLETINYNSALELQYSLVEKRKASEINDTLILLEHHPVITLGFTADESSIIADRKSLTKSGIELCSTDRGGDVTYHGPGQIVGYIICDLQESGINGAGRLIDGIEKMFINFLHNDFNIESEQQQGKRGVWIGNDKILAIGLCVKGRVTMHGFAFNVNPDPEHFKTIIPCGLKTNGITSLVKQRPYEYNIKFLKKQIAEVFAEYFGYDYVVYKTGAML